MQRGITESTIPTLFSNNDNPWLYRMGNYPSRNACLLASVDNTAYGRHRWFCSYEYCSQNTMEEDGEGSRPGQKIERNGSSRSADSNNTYVYISYMPLLRTIVCMCTRLLGFVASSYSLLLLQTTMRVGHHQRM